MKRKLSLIALCVFVSLTALAGASGGAGKGIKWHLDDGVLTITGQGPIKDFGKSRPWIAEFVKKLVVNEGVTRIGKNLCRDCNNLVYVSLPSTLTSIGDNAFDGCKNLSSIQIPFGVTDIGARAFYNCFSFIEIDLPISVKSVGKEAFAKCSNMSTARLSQSMETLGDNAFEDCKQLSNLSGLPAFVNTETFPQYGLNGAAVKNYWDRKEEMAQRLGSASGSQNQEKSSSAYLVEPSDIDIEIPYTGIESNNTFALIIANENYGKLANVPFARNDGNTFARYCRRTLGIPEKHIMMYSDASYGSMREAFSDLKMINEVAGKDMKVIVYYAGHGAPDDATLEPYLIPVDAARVNKDVCIPLSYVYQQLGQMELSSAMVFLDACFSGATREDKMMVNARGIARVPKKQGLHGNVAVFSATSEAETAMPYHEKGHGMFTYYLLKRIKETKGNVSLADLKEYVTKEVSLNSTIVNHKDQTPTLNVSSTASATWDTWKLTE